MRPKAPCVDCEDRKVGCHSTCERYQEWLAEYQKTKQEIFEKSHPEVRMYIRGRIEDRKK